MPSTVTSIKMVQHTEMSAGRAGKAMGFIPTHRGGVKTRVGFEGLNDSFYKLEAMSMVDQSGSAASGNFVGRKSVMGLGGRVGVIVQDSLPKKFSCDLFDVHKANSEDSVVTKVVEFRVRELKDRLGADEEKLNVALELDGQAGLELATKVVENQVSKIRHFQQQVSGMNQGTFTEFLTRRMNAREVDDQNTTQRMDSVGNGDLKSKLVNLKANVQVFNELDETRQMLDKRNEAFEHALPEELQQVRKEFISNNKSGVRGFNTLFDGVESNLRRQIDGIITELPLSEMGLSEEECIVELLEGNTNIFLYQDEINTMNRLLEVTPLDSDAVSQQIAVLEELKNSMPEFGQAAIQQINTSITIANMELVMENGLAPASKTKESGEAAIQQINTSIPTANMKLMMVDGLAPASKTKESGEVESKGKNLQLVTSLINKLKNECTAKHDKGLFRMPGRKSVIDNYIKNNGEVPSGNDLSGVLKRFAMNDTVLAMYQNIYQRYASKGGVTTPKETAFIEAFIDLMVEHCKNGERMDNKTESWEKQNGGIEAFALGVPKFAMIFGGAESFAAVLRDRLPEAN